MHLRSLPPAVARQANQMIGDQTLHLRNLSSVASARGAWKETGHLVSAREYALAFPHRTIPIITSHLNRRRRHDYPISDVLATNQLSLSNKFLPACALCPSVRLLPFPVAEPCQWPPRVPFLVGT